MRSFVALLSSTEIYEGCRTPSVHSYFSESSSDPSFSPCSRAREIYQGLRTPDWWTLSLRSGDTEAAVDEKLKVNPSLDAKKGFSKDGSELFTARTFKFHELATATKNFSADRLLGQGVFGRVYKGKLKSKNQVVAIKRFNSGTESNRGFIVQVMMHSLLHHPNIVNFIGYCAKGTQLLMVHEYMPLGSLEDLLNGLSSDKNHLDWNTRMKIAAGIAKALEYIHENVRLPVIFRGLKPSNILLGEGYHPKLSDLGLAKVAPVGDESTVQTRVIGTDGYCAPEYAMKATDNSEDAVEPSLIAWTQPFFKDKRKFQQMADPNLQGQYPVEGLRQSLAVAAMCVQEQPTERPRIADVVTALNDITSQP